MPVDLQSYSTKGPLDPYKLLVDLRKIVDLTNKLEARSNTTERQIETITRTVEVVAGDGGGGGGGPIPAPIGPFPSVIVDRALEGSGTAGAPINVRVDGTTVVINGSNQLESVSTPPAADTLTGTLTPTRVPFASALHVLSDSANLFWDDVNGRLGIGNSAPAETLHVTGTVRITSLTTPRIPYASTGGLLADSVALQWSNTPQTLQITHGAGVLEAPETNAKPDIHVGGDFDGVAAGIGAIYIDGYGAQGNFTMRRANGTQAAKTTLLDTNIVFNFRAYGYDTTDMALGGVMRMVADGDWSTTSHGTDFLISLVAPAAVGNPVERFRILGDGRVGIGNFGSTVPQATLQINGGSWFGFGLATSFQTTINIVGGISAADTTITVTSATNFPVAGVVRCQGELITYSGKTATTLTGCVRGRFGTTAAAHVNASIIALQPFISAESATSTVAMIVGPGNLYIGTTGDLFDIGSGSSVALMKIGTQFTVSGTSGVAWQDSGATGMAFFLWDGTNASFGTRTNAPVQIRSNNTGRAFFTGENLILDGATNSNPGTGSKCLVFGDGTVPGTIAANTAIVFANDVSGTVNIFAVNEAGVTNQLTGVDATYTPTRSAEVNLDANVTPSVAQYMRNGNFVTVSGRFTANPTTATVATSFELSLPIASNIGAIADLAGTAVCGAIASMCAEIQGSVANNTAVFSWIATDVTNQSWAYQYSYRVI